MIRQGAYLCDIGTDHAYLPLYLLEGGVITRAVCSDINERPLSSARRNAAERNMESKIDFVLTDGAEGLSSFGANDYSICGMGGELIIDIIERAEHLKKEGIHLILQPMTKCSELIKYLCENGFEILRQDTCKEGKKLYTVMQVCYRGEKIPHEEDFLYLGILTPETNKNHREYAELILSRLEKQQRSNPSLKNVSEIIRKRCENNV